MTDHTNAARQGASAFALCDHCLVEQTRAIANRIGGVLAARLRLVLPYDFHWHFEIDDVGLEPEDRFAWGMLTICNGETSWDLFLGQAGDGLLSLSGDVVMADGVDLIGDSDLIEALVHDAKMAFVPESK